MSDPRRRLPSVDALLAEESVAALTAQHPRALVVRAVRAVLHAAREDGGGPRRTAGVLPCRTSWDGSRRRRSSR
jgi:hypothetical protein